jgi:predicted AAA+ superfamily ATPase
MSDRGEVHYSDAVEERTSLSDRFGLWLSFYQTDMQGYLAIVDSHFRDFQGDRKSLHQAARLFLWPAGVQWPYGEAVFNAFSGRELQGLGHD